MLKPILSHLHLCELHNNSFALCVYVHLHVYVHVLAYMLSLEGEIGKSDYKKNMKKKHRGFGSKSTV